jgi:hypothetical protein
MPAYKSFLFNSADAAQEKKKREKKCCWPLVFQSLLFHTVFLNEKDFFYESIIRKKLK